MQETSGMNTGMEGGSPGSRHEEIGWSVSYCGPALRGREGIEWLEKCSNH